MGVSSKFQKSCTFEIQIYVCKLLTISSLNGQLPKDKLNPFPTIQDKCGLVDCPLWTASAGD